MVGSRCVGLDWISLRTSIITQFLQNHRRLDCYSWLRNFVLCSYSEILFN
uniref:Uncharacterized protein n=1 Tax=Rhizophora mucronata TaxID=61149 RepID=A0A2P2JUF4_RHIMU